MASRMAFAVPSPQIGSKAIAPVPQASQFEPHKGEETRGYTGTAPQEISQLAICLPITLLSSSNKSNCAPMARSHPVFGPFSIKNNHPFGTDSIQHEVIADSVAKSTTA